MGRLDGVECVEEGSGGCSGLPCFDTEGVLFLWSPGEAEAVLVWRWGGWNSSEESPGLDRARELDDQVELRAEPLFFWAYASAACMYRELPLGAL